MKKILDLEDCVMLIILKENRPLQLKEIAELINNKIGFNTKDLRIVLDNLTSNGYILKSTVDGIRFYNRNITEKEYNKIKIDKIIQKEFDMSLEELILNYMQNNNLDVNLKIIHNFIKKISND